MIVVLSDTHNLIRPELTPILTGAERILHAGDVMDRATLDKLAAFAPVTAVRGNCDRFWDDPLPEELLFSLHGKQVYMVHNRKQASSLADAADIVIFGHSHRYEQRQEGKQLWLNPGSCGPRRFGGALSLATLEIDVTSGEVTVQRIDLTPAAADAGSKRGGNTFGPGDTARMVETIVRELKRGKTVPEIIQRHGLPEDLTNQIVQIYYTHPGVDTMGILNRLEIAGK